MTVSQSEKLALEMIESVLEGRTNLIEAAHALLPLLMTNSDLASTEDLTLIRAIESETDHLPVGRTREQWQSDALREKDVELARCEAIWHEQMISSCHRIQRTLLLRKLMIDRHLNVAEMRRVVPVWRQEVAAILGSILRSDGIFPAEGREGFAYEGTSIGRVSSGAQVTLSRTDPMRPQIVAERRVEHYDNLFAAIDAFIDHEWGEGIDSIRLERGT